MYKFKANNMYGTRSQIRKDFSFKNLPKDLIKLNFLNKISKTKVSVSKKTGLVFHNSYKNSKLVLEEYSNKVFSNRMDIKKNLYNDSVPGMQARHFYVLAFINSFLNYKNKKIIDFACGQGGLLFIDRKYFKIKNLIGVEFSKKNILFIKDKFKKNRLNFPKLYNSNIENFTLKKKADIGILTWTLCNCSEPIEIVKSISNNIVKNGHVFVAQSSRILVPFKRPIFNYFNSKLDTGHLHPWHFSYNSLNNIFKYCGFTLEGSNNFVNENDMILVFKNSKNYNQKFVVDNCNKVVKFFKRWNDESKKYIQS